MTERKQFRAIKGTRDILPPDSALWNRIEQTARDTFRTYAFGEIRLPIFEQTDLFSRSIGEETDVVSKEMYSFEDQPGDSISLRPEATASVVRAYIEHGMQTLPGNAKLYYIGPMFRRERPQKGRYRQFYQIGAEVLGPSDAPAIDAEVIEMLMVFFERAGLNATVLAINSIGCRDCRPKYVELLREALRKVKDRLGPDSQRRIETNPLRVLDSKLTEEQALIEKLPRIADHLCSACREHFAKLQEELKLRGLAYEINARLVRGLDYYTRTTFEVTAAGLGSQNAVCGGGRYDGLVELLGGPAGVKGIGFAIGTDRVILSLQEGAKTAAPARPYPLSKAAASAGVDLAIAASAIAAVPAGLADYIAGAIAAVPAGLAVFIAWLGASAAAPAARLAFNLRRHGHAVELPPEEMKLKKFLGLADKLGARYAVIIGENEVATGQYTVKNLVDGVQRTVSEDELLALLKKA